MLCIFFAINAEAGTDLKPKEWQINGALAALRDKIPEVKAEALRKAVMIRIFTRITKTEIPSIVALLEYDKPDVRRDAVMVLGQLSELSKDYIPQIAARLQDNDLYVRRAAVRALGQLSELSKDYIPQIADLIDNNKPEVRSAAANALGQLGELSKDYVPRITARLEDDIPYVRRDAVEALAQLGELSKDSIPQIAARLQDDDWLVRQAAVGALGQFRELSKDYIPQIAARLQDDNDSVTISVAETLGQLGELSKDYIPQIVACLKVYGKPEVRSAAANALGQLGELSKDYIPQIAALLENNKPEVRSAAANALGQLGELSKDYIPQIAARLEDDKPYVRRYAVKALGQLGELSKDYIPQIAARLQDNDWGVRPAAVRALGQLGELSKDYIPQIAARLQDDFSEEIRYATFGTLIRLGELSKDYIPQIVACLEDINWDIRRAAVRALGQMGELSKDYIPLIVVLLEKGGPDDRQAALKALGQLGKLSKDYIPQIAARLQDNDLYVRKVAVETLGQLGELSKDHIPQIAARLVNDHQYVRNAAFEALGKFAELSKDYIPLIAAHIQTDNWGVRVVAVEALSKIAEVGPELIVPILNPIYYDVSWYAKLRLYAHLVGAGKDNVEILLRWLGEPKNNYPNAIGHSEAKRTLEIFAVIWEETEAFPRLRSDLAKQIAVVASKRDIRWSRNEVDLLRSHAEELEVIDSPHAEALRNVIASLETKTRIFQIAQICLIHVLFWLMLIFAYPYSSKIQAIFFWNPYVRILMGLGYVNFALTWVPYLRMKLFQPFRDSLLAHAALDDFDEEVYFEKSEVKPEKSRKTIAVKEAIPQIKGQIVLEGESGLGKSMFIRYLLEKYKSKKIKRLAVYLPAAKCSKGVMEAIGIKLHGVAKDEKFLRNLIFSGAIDICIDGLNEVSAETRANLTQFVESYFRGNFLIATQPIQWEPPAKAATYVLQPLRREHMEEYFISRYRILPEEDVAVSAEDYNQAWKNYVSHALDEDQPKEMLDSIQRTLSNPMDLDIVAQMIAYGREPNLFSLQEQQYQIMAEYYERVNIGRKFPLTEFSERVFQMRLNDEAKLPKGEFIEEIKCMERYKMVLSRQDLGEEPIKEWFFRHDKIMEFFVVQTFLKNGDRPSEHMGESRFRGTYFLLADLMPLDAAIALQQELVEYAADTKDHSVSDNFIQLVRSRKARRAA
jgi:HEAT repeat protein